jgi:hypothetical protein
MLTSAKTARACSILQSSATRRRVVGGLLAEVVKMVICCHLTMVVEMRGESAQTKEMACQVLRALR